MSDKPISMKDYDTLTSLAKRCLEKVESVQGTAEKERYRRILEKTYEQLVELEEPYQDEVEEP